MHISAAASTTPRDDNFLSWNCQILQLKPCQLIYNNRTWGHKECDIFSRSTLAVMRAARLSMLCPPLLSMGKGNKRINPRFRLKDNAATATAIPTVGASTSNVLFSTKATNAVATIASD